MTPQSDSLELIGAETPAADIRAANLRASVSAKDILPVEMEVEPNTVNFRAGETARSLAWIPGQDESRHFRDRCERLSRAFRPLLVSLQARNEKDVTGELIELRANSYFLSGELGEICTTFEAQHKLPLVRTLEGSVVPRIAAVAVDFLNAHGFRFSDADFTSYIEAFQEITVLKMAELWMLIPVMKLTLLEQVAERGRRLLEDQSGPYTVHAPFRSLQEIKQTSWKTVIEPLILFDHVLRKDPAGAYARMDYDTRELYRKQLVSIADRCDCSEIKVATETLALARRAQDQPNSDPRVILRESHVGWYLLAEGAPILRQRVRFHPTLALRLRIFLLEHPDEIYLPGIAVLTLAIVSSVVVLLTPPTTPLWIVMLAILIVALPGSQSAVQIMNYFATLLLPAKPLPKLDFSNGLPDDCVSLVAIPTMLMDEKQVRRMVDQLEIRYLGNQDPNIHYALLSDLPDSASQPREETAPLVDLASKLIEELNEKYSSEAMGTFFLFHRHRVYNPRERLWMGWERKRGKLMDLNNLLRGGFDSFPVKIGDLSLLPTVRFVITLDSDTELPRGSARRMAGTLAHPLNQAIVDPEKSIVVAGYGILQPRVGVSVQSSTRSRLANIYSGQTGFDIYTHATSDVYQDLYGEGIFVGKGIYEVDTLHRVLDRRFPRNALLSHDLVEGAYARAGLASDIEVIEDYPSHYSAHNRRKHRWMRGDWQIAGWLLPTVPEESGSHVPNPLSVVSRWKILDNLRRSLVEPALFILFVLGWTSFPGHGTSWTVATLLILFLPALVQLAYDGAHAVIRSRRSVVADAYNSFLNASIANLLMVTFLAHQALLSLDAVVRTMVRRLITRQRLLQWETAAEAEMAGARPSALDIYLDWAPVVALGLFLLIWVVRPNALLSAVPLLLLWACSKPVSVWMNRPPVAPRKQASERDRWLLRISALRTWRYFAEFSTEEHHWLIPDNVQEMNTKVAARVSPTNLGLLLNARQVACEFGYLTVPEFAQNTLRSLAVIEKLQKHRGHLLNWYDTQTLVPFQPAVVSSVDNGNFVASLWTLEQGAHHLLEQPLFPHALADGVLDHLSLLANAGAIPRHKSGSVEKALRQENWLQYLLDVPDADLKEIHSSSAAKNDTDWFQQQVEERIQQVSRVAQLYAPWLLTEYAVLQTDLAAPLLDGRGEPPRLKQMPGYIDTLATHLRAALDSTKDAKLGRLYGDLLALLPETRTRVVRLIEDLRKIADLSSRFVEEMDFSFLLNRNRMLFSVAYELDKQQIHPACYDLLASEARTAYFIAIAKDDIPQDCWFELGRPLIQSKGVTGLLSWTGTMFEYLMPTIWTRVYPNTLLEHATEIAVKFQREYAGAKGVPWGISECSSSKLDDGGNYHYFAFGVPDLAIHKPEQDGPVISPYSTFLALGVDPVAALKNLRYMERKHWLGPFGFYEALDFTPRQHKGKIRGAEIVRCWMAHHQGMTLLAIANFLDDNVAQRWFHSHPRVQATELLLQEKSAGRSGAAKARAKVA
jgi:cyclic beta-1,2-glucan synthetase